MASRGPDSPYLEADPAARYLRVSRWSLRNRSFRERHQIPTLTVGRRILFSRAQLDAWLTERRRG
jgi:excisionase family DNA binding protein